MHAIAYFRNLPVEEESRLLLLVYKSFKQLGLRHEPSIHRSKGSRFSSLNLSAKPGKDKEQICYGIVHGIFAHASIPTRTPGEVEAARRRRSPNQKPGHPK